MGASFSCSCNEFSDSYERTLVTKKRGVNLNESRDERLVNYMSENIVLKRQLLKYKLKYEKDNIFTDEIFTEKSKITLRGSITPRAKEKNEPIKNITPQRQSFISELIDTSRSKERERERDSNVKNTKTIPIEALENKNNESRNQSFKLHKIQSQMSENQDSKRDDSKIILTKNNNTNFANFENNNKLIKSMKYILLNNSIFSSSKKDSLIKKTDSSTNKFMINSTSNSSIFNMKESISSRTRRITKKEDLIIPFRRQNTNINKILFLNENEIIINEKKLLSLDKTSVIYDIEIFKINLFKNEYKESKKYVQINKGYFKYFKSIYSSSVWLDKPLMKLPIENIDKLVIGSNNISKLKINCNICVLLQIYIKFNENFPFNNKYDLLYINDQNSSTNLYMLEFGLEDEETGKNIIRILGYLKDLINKKLI